MAARQGKDLPDRTVATSVERDGLMLLSDWISVQLSPQATRPIGTLLINKGSGIECQNLKCAILYPEYSRTLFFSLRSAHQTSIRDLALTHVPPLHTLYLQYPDTILTLYPSSVNRHHGVQIRADGPRVVHPVPGISGSEHGSV